MSLREVTGTNLWSGIHGQADMSNLGPPLVICLQGRRACDIDFFSSTAERVLCCSGFAKIDGSADSCRLGRFTSRLRP